MLIGNNFYKIAIADDDQDDHLLFEMALKEVSLEAILQPYSDGAKLMDALARPDAEVPDIIFLDVNMPRKNGFQCLKEIRGQEKFRDVPVVILTTSSHNEDEHKASEIGANMYLRKPSDFSSLKRLISKVLEGYLSDFVC